MMGFMKRGVWIKFIALAVALQMLACGTILYPERKGQRGGRIDPAVAVMDGLGLLLFIIPGVIAYAVDFSTGAIYLPGTAESDGRLKVVYAAPDGLTVNKAARIVAEETGSAVPLMRAEVYLLEDRATLESALANTRVKPGDLAVSVVMVGN